MYVIRGASFGGDQDVQVVRRVAHKAKQQRSTPFLEFYIQKTTRRCLSQHYYRAVVEKSVPVID